MTRTVPDRDARGVALPAAVPAASLVGLTARIAGALGLAFDPARAEHGTTVEAAGTTSFPDATCTVAVWLHGDGLVEHRLTEGDNGADNSRAFEYLVEHAATIEVGPVRIGLSGGPALTRALVEGPPDAVDAVCALLHGDPG